MFAPRSNVARLFSLRAQNFTFVDSSNFRLDANLRLALRLLFGFWFCFFYLFFSLCTLLERLTPRALVYRDNRQRLKRLSFAASALRQRPFRFVWNSQLNTQESLTDTQISLAHNSRSRLPHAPSLALPCPRSLSLTLGGFWISISVSDSHSHSVSVSLCVFGAA